MKVPSISFGGSQNVGKIARFVDARKIVCDDALVTSCTIIIAERAG